MVEFDGQKPMAQAQASSKRKCPCLKYIDRFGNWMQLVPTCRTMARREQLEQKGGARGHRYFSEDFRVARVREIERGTATVSEVSKAYGVSGTAVYNWIYQYSTQRKQGIRQVVEAKSATQKVLRLKEEVKDLHARLGEKQLRIEFLEKLIEMASEQYGIDLKKSSGTRPSFGSGRNVKAGSKADL